MISIQNQQRNDILYYEISQIWVSSGVMGSDPTRGNEIFFWKYPFSIVFFGQIWLNIEILIHIEAICLIFFYKKDKNT